MTPYPHLQKAAKKAGILFHDASNIVLSDHEHRIAPADKMVNMKLDLTEEFLKRVDKIANALKVKRDAVIVWAIHKTMQADRQRSWLRQARHAEAYGGEFGYDPIEDD